MDRKLNEQVGLRMVKHRFLSTKPSPSSRSLRPFTVTGLVLVLVVLNLAALEGDMVVPTAKGTHETMWISG